MFRGLECLVFRAYVPVFTGTYAQYTYTAYTHNMGTYTLNNLPAYFFVRMRIHRNVRIIIADATSKLKIF